MPSITELPNSADNKEIRLFPILYHGAISGIGPAVVAFVPIQSLQRGPIMFQIKAVDNGRPQLKETCRVLFTVINRPSQSPSRPRFLDGARRVTVMESDRVGHMVALVTAEDADGDKIWYSIIGKCTGVLFENN